VVSLIGSTFAELYMQVEFFKYQGTGNDFVVIDNRSRWLSLSSAQIIHLCDRKFGIGSDGLILIEPSSVSDFSMVFYNPDASQSFCGNGSRCAVHFAKSLGLFQNSCVFEAIDGLHKAHLEGERVSIEMRPVSGVKQLSADSFFLNTGSPHVVQFVSDVNQENVVEQGRKLRYDSAFSPAGTNVNFVELKTTSSICVRTYERGVENETLSCGTGVTASALATVLLTNSRNKEFSENRVKVITPGGELEVSWTKIVNGTFEQIELAGPAHLVFSGTIDL
jgi:diaminopimelate epimerase